MNFLNWFETQTRLFPNAMFVDLVHVRTAGSARLKRYVLPPEDPASIASLVLTDAHQAAEALRGVQTFSVALMEESKTEPASEHMMRVGDAMGPGASYDSESPSLEGVCKQLMRHTEALMRSHTLGAQQTHNTLAQENERLRARLDTLEGRHFETIALQEELLSQRHERDIESVRATRAEARKDQLLGKVSGLLPTVASKFLGPTVQQDPAVAALAESLSPEQVRAIASVLRPDQAAALGTIFHKHRPANNEAAAGKPSGNPGNGGNNDKAN